MIGRLHQTVVVAVALAATAACSDSDSATPLPPGGSIVASSSSSAGGGGAGGNPVTGSGGASGGAGGTGGGVGGSGHGGAPPLLLGAIPIVDVDDTPCPGTPSLPVQVYPASPDLHGFDRLQVVGTRRMATSVSSPVGFVTFDADGSNALAAPVSVASNYDVAASEGATIGLTGETASGIVYRRYDAQAAAVTSLLTVAGDSPVNLAIGGGGGQALVVWGVQGKMRARGIDPSGAFAGSAIDFGAGSLDGYFVGSVAFDAPGFAVAWTGALADGSYRSSFAKSSTSALSGPVLELTTATQAHAISKIVKTASGYALLINADLAPKSLLVVILDATGKLVGSAHRLLGALHGWDLATVGGELGVVAKLETGSAAFRPLDATGEPLAGWSCFYGPFTDTFQQSSIDADGAGYAILFRDSDGAQQLLSIDHLGGVP